MSELIPSNVVETLVGAKRHPVLHLGRADSQANEVYILHSQECKDSGIDLRDCLYSEALDYGIYEKEWEGFFDTAVILELDPDLDTLIPVSGAGVIDFLPETR